MKKLYKSIVLFISIVISLITFVLNGFRTNHRKLDFLIIGAQKSGTSALEAYLSFNPEIGMANRKEVHYFSSDVMFKLPTWLRETWYQQYFEGRKINQKVVGEATPNYMVEPRFIDRIHDYNSAIKLIVILRDPVSRAYSHWNMQCQRGLEHRSFDQAIADNLDQLKAKNELDHTVSYIARGHYAQQLSYILSVFPRDQVLVLFQQELKLDPLKVMNQLVGFLGVSPYRRMDSIHVHTRDYHEPMSDTVKKQLTTYFIPEIQALEELLNVDLSNWKE